MNTVLKIPTLLSKQSCVRILGIKPVQHLVVNSYTAKSSAEESVNNGLLLSDSCVNRLKQLCEGKDNFLRLTVEGGGCSGFQYKFDIDERLNDDDKIFQRDGAKLVIDETSLEYVKGSTVDYHEELIRSAFRVSKNPNADVGCSCGASFAIKLD